MELTTTTEVIGPLTGVEADAAGTAESVPRAVATPDRNASVGQLRRERKRLWADRQDAVYHLGGLVLELDARGQTFGRPLTRRIAAVRTMDLRLGELDERLSSVDDRGRGARVRTAAPEGYCMSCGGPYLHEASYCSSCGARIHRQVASEQPDAETQVIESGAR